MSHSPSAGGDEGCSSYPAGGMIQLTAGNWPEAMSETKSPGYSGRKAFWCSAEFGSLYCAN